MQLLAAITIELCPLQMGACFLLQPYRNETWRIALFSEHEEATKNFDSKENAKIRCDAIETENRFGSYRSQS